jgi:hypothetical protein
VTHQQGEPANETQRPTCRLSSWLCAWRQGGQPLTEQETRNGRTAASDKVHIAARAGV